MSAEDEGRLRLEKLQALSGLGAQGGYYLRFPGSVATWPDRFLSWGNGIRKECFHAGDSLKKELPDEKYRAESKQWPIKHRFKKNKML